jgi:hypothetical protein
MASSLDHLCTLTGQCFSLASQVATSLAEYLPVVGSVASLASSIASNKLAYGLLLRETQMTTALAKEFAKTLEVLAELQKTSGMQICAYESGLFFLTELKKLLAFYTPSFFNDSQKKISPEWYRTELLRYTTYIQAYLNNIRLVTMDIRQRRDRIMTSVKPTERQAELDKLKAEYTCHEFTITLPPLQKTT